MKVQRAPRANQQPEQPPEGWRSAVALREDRTPVQATNPVVVPATVVQYPAPTPTGSTRFQADVELDLTDTRRASSDPNEVVAHVLVCLLAACRANYLIDDNTRVQVLTPYVDGWAGASFDQAARQSVHGIRTGLSEASPVIPDNDPGVLRVVRLDSNGGVHGTSDWGLPGLGTITIGASTPVARPWAQDDTPSLSIVTRWTAKVGLSMAYSTESARAVVNALAEAERTISATVTV